MEGNITVDTTISALATEGAGGNVTETESVLVRGSKEYIYLDQEFNSQITKISPTSLRLDPLYIQVYLIYLNLFVHGIIPFVLLVFFNTSIYRQVCYVTIFVGRIMNGCIQG